MSIYNCIFYFGVFVNLPECVKSFKANQNVVVTFNLLHRPNTDVEVNILRPFGSEVRQSGPREVPGRNEVDVRDRPSSPRWVLVSTTLTPNYRRAKGTEGQVTPTTTSDRARSPASQVPRPTVTVAPRPVVTVTHGGRCRRLRQVCNHRDPCTLQFTVNSRCAYEV